MRNWEDEKAYVKSSSQQEKQLQRNPQDEFPELGSRKSKPSSREEKENKMDDNRRSNKSPNHRSQQTHQEGGHRSQGDRYDNNRSYNDIFDGNRQHDDRPQSYEMSRSHSSHDAGRSQNERFDGSRSSKFFENNRQNDRYEGNRQQNDHFDNNRSNNRYDSRYSSEQNERHQSDRYDNKRSSDKFDGNRIDRYDQRMERGGDKGNWDRRGGKMNDNRSGGYRPGKNTIEYKNQNRNNVNNPPQTQSGGKGFASSGFNQRQPQNAEYESEMPVESLSFTNSKLSAVPQSMTERYSANLDYGQMDGSRHRNVGEMDRPERPITGRQLGPSSSSRTSSQIQQSPLPIANPIHTQQPSLNIQQQISSQPVQQQPQLLPQQQNTNLMSTESRSAKRYSTLRQRTTEAVQNLSIPQHLHEQQMLLQDAALMLQMQQSQEQIQPNLAHQPPSTNYSAQPMPLQIQNEYAAHGPKSQASGSGQTNQQPLIQTPSQNQSASQTAQYPPPYFASNELQSSTAIQPAAQSLMNTQQYPAQYPQQPAAPPYVQPPPQTSYIQPAVNQQQQLLNYVPSIPPAQQPFPTVQSFTTYPPAVPNYNPVPVS